MAVGFGVGRAMLFSRWQGLQSLFGSPIMLNRPKITTQVYEDPFSEPGQNNNPSNSPKHSRSKVISPKLVPLFFLGQTASGHRCRAKGAKGKLSAVGTLEGGNRWAGLTMVWSGRVFSPKSGPLCRMSLNHA